jgi:methionine--tRNA ligase beta chain
MKIKESGDMITYEDFKKLEMRVGKVLSVEDMKRAERLYKIRVDIGDREIQLVSSLKEHYTKEELVGKTIVVLTNLSPAKFSGELSEGMLLAAELGDKCVLLTTDRVIETGAPIT